LLVIARDERPRGVLSEQLHAAGHQILTASNGGDGLRLAREQRPDLMLVDDDRLDTQATEVCRSVKWDPITRDIPVVILSNQNQEVDRIVALELGAEDYVVKPFSVRELVLRVRAILRHRPANDRPSSEAFGALRIDCDAHRVWVDDQPVQLTVLEFRLLELLFQRRGQVQPRAATMREIWGAEEGEEGGRALDTCVKRLRQKLGRAGHYVETVRSVGYRFRAAP
jgi:two-component system, OmpR family, phosphate regulon response regulator PhoB